MVALIFIINISYMTKGVTKIIFLNKYTKDKSLDEIKERFWNIHIDEDLFVYLLNTQDEEKLNKIKSYWWNLYL